MKDKGYVEAFVGNVQNRLLTWFAIQGLLITGIVWVTYRFLSNDIITIIVVMLASTIIFSILCGIMLTKSLTKPTRYIAQAVMHISPTEHLVAAPNMEELRLGRELASTLARQIYDYATATQATPADGATPAIILDQLPVAVIGLNDRGIITTVNSRALTVLKEERVAGEAFDSYFTLAQAIGTEVSLPEWLTTARTNSVTELKTWQKVEIKSLNQGTLGYFDIAASFNKHSASGIETIITLYDHSDAYGDESAAISFIAMAVHELRTPVTILRGYIEAFDEEIDTTNPQTMEYLHKMSASAQGLSSFISNILNVARINQNQLELKLAEGNWNTVLPEVIDGLRNRAAVHGKTIELRMEPDLPPAALDRLTISEVVTNLIDNAIKYSPDNATNIIVMSRRSTEGLIETTVQDFGVGIPASVMPNLFSKFTRNHRNQATIGGTGLGLYLSKAIVSAHHGHIWANSQENEGSTFGFTLLPYDQLAKDQQTNNNENIVHTSHGWIKNHSMQRR